MRHMVEVHKAIQPNVPSLVSVCRATDFAKMSSACAPVVRDSTSAKESSDLITVRLGGNV